MQLTTEGVCITYLNKQLFVLLQIHNQKPFKGKWGLPMLEVKSIHTIEKTLRLLAKSYPSLSLSAPVFAGLYSDPARHPKSRVVAATYMFFSSPDALEKSQPDHAWHPIDKLPSSLIMDHKQIIKKSKQFLQSLTNHAPLLYLMPERFTLSELQLCMETLFDVTLDKRNFRKKIISSGWINPTRQRQQNVAHKAATYYTLNKKKAKESSI